MFEAISLKNHIIRNSIKLAEELENQAKNILISASHLIDPQKLFNDAYQIYQAIAENKSYATEFRGQAAYRMWLLSKENLVELKQTLSQTKEQANQELLSWAAECGCQEAQQEINRQKNFLASQNVSSSREKLSG